ncbi:hypothetical protein TWF506_004797 [Arthrobotrys conoides]|uniref:Uncharacterized protein n=1 Tax=Arthrobotrys conoides TaxID=74498 RepID=A0AAN8N088_9PEZI
MTYAPVVDSNLEALWTLWFIHDQYHRVRQYVGYIDIETASETLQRAKENLRASASRSIDDTEDVYPVVFSPANWAKHLSTNFKPKDLLSNVNTDCRQTRHWSFEKATNEARSQLTKAQSDLGKSLSDTALSLVTFYLQRAIKTSANPAEAIKTLKWDTVATQLKISFDGPDKRCTTRVLEALGNLYSGVLQKEITKGGTKLLSLLESQIKSVSMDIN